MTKTSGSILLTESLKAMGVDTIFFLRGGPMGEVAELATDAGFRLIDVRDERAASMMAMAYARVTGKPGVCMTGAGPDTTNITTGISNAAMDCVPVIAICGSATLRTYMMHSFQETDQLGVMKSIAKRAWRVPMAEYDRDPARIEHQARIVASALRLMRVARELIQFTQEFSHETPEQLLDLARGRSAAGIDRSIDTQVSRLRKKLELDPSDPKIIKTVWGGGYMFTPTVTHQ